MKRYLPALLFGFISLIANAQQTNIPYNHLQYSRFEAALYSAESDFHTSIKPYREALVRELVNPDSLDRFGYTNSKFANSWFGRRIFKQHAVLVDSSKFQLYLDPAFNLEVGKDMANDSSAYVNTRGVQLGGSIGKKFSFYTAFYENQAKYPMYVADYVDSTSVIPGQGRTKTFKNNAFDFSSAVGYISFTPSKHFNIQFGHGKNFIGDGYRSLLLSDFGFNYPYLKLTTTVWKLQYTNLFTSFLDIEPSVVYEAGYPKKYGSFHYLSYNICKRVSVGFFEGIIWQARDSSGTRGFDINYLNPIIYYRPIEFNLGSPDNAIVGLNAKVKVLKKTSVYGQLVIDDINFSKMSQGSGFFQNKLGYQIGFKSYDIFKVKNLFAQLEYNQVRPYTYAHKTPLQNYSHFNEALAHPLGANFKEVVGILSYQFKDISLQMKTVYAIVGRDSAGVSYGQNIFNSDFDAVNGAFSFNNEIGQGVRTTLMINDIRLAYLINPATNLNLFLGYRGRRETFGSSENTTTYVYFGFRTALRNLYYDF